MKKLLFIILMVGLYSTVASAGDVKSEEMRAKLGALKDHAGEVLLKHTYHKEVADKLGAHAAETLKQVSPEVHDKLKNLGDNIAPIALHNVTEELHQNANTVPIENAVQSAT